MNSNPDVQRLIRTRHYRPPEIWALIREGWESGETASEMARRYDVGTSTVLNRSKREGWVLKIPTRPAEPVVVRPLRGSLEIAEVALAVASEALQRGRAAEAVALIKAGDSVGAFAHFVADLRARAARGEELLSEWPSSDRD